MCSADGAENEAFLSTFLQRYGTTKELTVTAEELQMIYHDLRPTNSLSSQQTKAAIETICSDCALCFKEDILPVLKEMDRRNLLMRDIGWEFEMLDRENRGSITEQDASFLYEALHGKAAAKKWLSKFIAERPLPGSRISLGEVELFFCAPQGDLHFMSSDDDEDEKIDVKK